MNQTVEFATLLTKIRSIIAFGKNGITTLTPGPVDRFFTEPIHKHLVDGLGTREDPFRLRYFRMTSDLHSIITLWWAIRDNEKYSPPVFIKVGEWMFQIQPNGVISEGGHFTQLI